MHIPSLLSLLSTAVLASAAKLTISVPPSPPALPNPAALPPSTHAVLIGAPGIKHSAPLRRDNTFVFDSLPESSYLLAIHSRDHFFLPYRVDVGRTKGDTAQEIVHVWQTFRGNEWSNKGPHLGSAEGELKIEVRPAAQKDFYQVRSGFSVMSIFKNPMILMGLFSVVMIVGMPKLMENSKCYSDRMCGTYHDGRGTDLSQWMKRPRKSWRRFSKAPLEARAMLRTRCRISIWLVSCQESPAAETLALERRNRHNDTAWCDNVQTREGRSSLHSDGLSWHHIAEPGLASIEFSNLGG